MPNLIINKVPSSSGSVGSLVIDKFVATTFTESTVSEYHWRWEDTPTMSPQPLGSTADGTPLAIPFDLQGRAIRTFLVSITADGRRSVSDVRLAEQTVFTPDPTLGILTDLGDSLSDGGNVLTNSE
jgi:hypothetical protein